MRYIIEMKVVSTGPSAPDLPPPNLPCPSDQLSALLAAAFQSAETVTAGDLHIYNCSVMVTASDTRIIIELLLPQYDGDLACHPQVTCCTEVVQRFVETIWSTDTILSNPTIQPYQSAAITTIRASWVPSLLVAPASAT